jgi:NADH dehydrogenase [ubiquinone] 1 alpha subcomplex assembly factor 7
MATPLAERLARQIHLTGPISVADFMAACLYDPAHGYYATRPRIGEAGDFITAPELSQMFGELIGAWCAHEWMQLGAPDPFHLIELGPGSGALMADVLRAGAAAPGFVDAARVNLVETSAPLRAAQAERLGANAAWRERLEDAPAGPSLLIANEFLDCLPIRQFVRKPDGFRERLVGLGGAGALTFGLGARFPQAPEARLPHGAVFEFAPALPALVAALGERLRAAPGRALLIDYGYCEPEGADTLQALRGHQKQQPLAAPGEADLTAHVDFGALLRLAREAGLDAAGPAPQGDFLAALGLRQRAAALARANPQRAERIGRELERLAGEAAMGALFKAACLSSPGLSPPAGF